jgi:hypothetical protein
MRGGPIENQNHQMTNNLITGEYGLVSTPLNGRRDGNMFYKIKGKGSAILSLRE